MYIYIIHTVFVCFCACDKCLLTQFAAELKDLDLVAWDPERNMPTTRLQRWDRTAAAKEIGRHSPWLPEQHWDWVMVVLVSGLSGGAVWLPAAVHRNPTSSSFKRRAYLEVEGRGQYDFCLSAVSEAWMVRLSVLRSGSLKTHRAWQ